MSDIDRSWAANLSEEEYQHEFLRRFPRADAIPTRADYLGSTADQVERINFPSLGEDAYEPDTGLERPHISETDAARAEAELAAKGVIFCSDCPDKRTFETLHALRIHRSKAHG